MKKALVILAEGAEEMEVSIVVDVLRRGGIQVVLAGLAGSGAIRCSRGVQILPDTSLSESGDDYDVIVLPGGAGGAKALAASEEVGTLLRHQAVTGRDIAAICAAPLALASHGVLSGHSFTSHPSVSAELSEAGNWSASIVVEDGQLITSQGPGTSFEFALTLVRRLAGEDKAAAVRTPLMLTDTAAP